MGTDKKATSQRVRESSREVLLDAGTELFAQHGFDGATVEMIAHRAGVNRALISYHFGGKEGLYDAILETTFIPAGDRLRQIRQSPGRADARLRQFIDLFVETAAGRPHLPAMILREVLAGGTHLKPRYADYMVSNFQLVREIVEQGIRERTFRPIDPFLTHLNLVGGLVFFLATKPLRQRWIREGRLSVPVPVARDYVEHVKELVTRGLAAGPARRSARKNEEERE